MTLDNLRPQLRSPETPWTGPHEGGSVSPMTGLRTSTLTWRRGTHESVTASPDRLVWITPGFTLVATTEHEATLARAHVLARWDDPRAADRLKIINMAWDHACKEK